MKSCPLCGADAQAEQAACDCGYRFSASPSASVDLPANPSEAKGLTVSGWLMSLVGVALAIYSLAIFDPSVAPDIGVVNLDPYNETTPRINNLGLLQRQLMLFIGGCSMLISGVIMCVAGAVSDAIKRK